MENQNMKIYDAVRKVPDTALKKIQAGRLKGKSDINPMWRIKMLTEQFGCAGIGWYYTIDKQWIEAGAGGEIAAFVNISLYVKNGDEWSKPVQGTGGSAFVAKERAGLYTSDECYKMALTDAISVACKAMGFAADVYWDTDKTKYGRYSDSPPTPPNNLNGSDVNRYFCSECGAEIKGQTDKNGIYNPAKTVSEKCHGMCVRCAKLNSAKKSEG